MGQVRRTSIVAASRRHVPTLGAALLLCPAGALAAPGQPARAGGTTVQVAEELPAFSARIERLGAADRRAMTPSVWRKGCPVGLADLRAIRARHVGFDGRARTGVIVVHRARAAGVVAVLRRLYEAHFPIRRMLPIERYGGSDSRSIDADNTSAFNCRRVTGGTGWSEHAYGRAIDLNPIENPYVTGAGTTEHAASEPFLDRRDVRPGMASEGTVAVRAFADARWRWGGRWSAPTDYQHFSTTGR